MDLPAWPDGTVAVLSTAAGPPHAIPVSTAVRSGPATVHFALALRRDSLARLREDPHCALTVLATEVAITAQGTASVVQEDERIAFVRLDVESMQDHGQATFAIESGVGWRWTDPDAERADAELRERLRAL